MQKRGQVTLFVFLGILILILIIVLFYLRNVQIESSEDLSQNIDISQTKQEVDNIVQTCLNDISERAVWIATEHGGYALETNREYSCEELPFNLADYIYVDRTDREHLDDYTYFGVNGKNGMNPIPTEQINDHSRLCLESFIRNKLISCMNSFVPLVNKNWNVKIIGAYDSDGVDVDVEIEEKVFVEANVPREFSRDKNVFQIGEYSYVVDFDLGLMFSQLEYAKNNICSVAPESIAEVLKDGLDEQEYNVIYFERNKGAINGYGEAHQFIIKKDDYRFKFGLAC